MSGHRPPSPAEDRTGLHPAHVDALARQLHDLTCLRVWEVRLDAVTVTDTPDTFWPDPRHAEVDRGRARFILLGLHRRDRLTLTPTT